MPETPSPLLAQDSSDALISVSSSTMRIEIISTELLEQKTLTSIIALKSQRWSRLSKQIFRVDKWSLCQG
jgi:hypothetical protein